MDLVTRIHNQLCLILEKLELLGVIRSFSIDIDPHGICEDKRSLLLSIEETLEKCLSACRVRPRQAEIRNVITKLVHKKNIADLPFNKHVKNFPSQVRSCRVTDFSLVKEDLASRRAPLTCDICHKEFNSKLALLKRESRHEKIETFSCRTCKEQLSEVSDWECHMVDIHSEFRNEGSPKKEKEKAHGISVATAAITDDLQCDRRVEQELSCAVKATMNFPSPSCQDVNKNSIELGVADDVKTQIRSDFSGSRYKAAMSDRPKVFSCSYTDCNKVFKLSRSLSKHLRLKHLSNVPNFTCSHCDKLFLEKGKLNRHLLTHSNGQFRCVDCGDRFSRGDVLKRHIFLTHQIHKNFICKYCQKRFSLKSNRDVHERNVHGGEANFIQCEFCGQKSKNKSTYQAHLRTHIKKHLSCSFCKKTFARKVRYQLHMKNKHPGCSPFQSLLDSVAASNT